MKTKLDNLFHLSVRTQKQYLTAVKGKAGPRMISWIPSLSGRWEPLSTNLSTRYLGVHSSVAAS